MGKARQGYLRGAIPTLVKDRRTDLRTLQDAIIPETLESEGAGDTEGFSIARDLLETIWLAHTKEAASWLRSTDVVRLQGAFG